MASLNSFIEMLVSVDQDLPIYFGGDVYNRYQSKPGPGQLLAPRGFCSYRGYYQCPALEPVAMTPGLKHEPTVGSLLAETQLCIGMELASWKGGHYTMEGHKALFVAEPGDTTDLGIFGVVVADDRAIIVTYNVNDYLFET